MKKSTFNKEFERLTEKEKNELADFWETEIDVDKIFQKANDIFFEKIQKLSPAESKILRYIIEAGEIITESSIISHTELDAEEVKNGIEKLTGKLIVYIRKSLAKLTSGNNRVLLFDYVKNNINNYELYNNLDFITQRLDNGYLYLDYKENSIFDLFFQNNGFINAYSAIAKDNELDKYYQKGVINYILYFNGEKIIPAYILKEELFSTRLPNEKVFTDKGLYFLIALGRMYYTLVTKKVLLNKSGELCKYDTELMNGIFINESITNFFIDTMLDFGFLETDGKTLIAKSEIKDFLHKDLTNVYRDLIDNNQELKWFIDDFLKEKWEFASADVIREAKKLDITAKRVMELLDIAYFIGFLEISPENTYRASVLFEGYQNNVFDIKSDKPGFIVNTNFSLVAEKEDLSIFDDFFFKTFFNVENDAKVVIYKMDKKAFLRGIFLGFNPEILFEIMRERAKKPVPDIIFTVLKDWIDSYKEVKLKTILVIEGDKDVIDILNYHREVQKYILERRGENILEIHREAANIRFIEDEDIFIINED